MIDETEKTIKTLSSDVNVTLHQTNELLAKGQCVLADDINIKVATIDPYSLQLWRTCQSQYLTSISMHVS